MAISPQVNRQSTIILRLCVVGRICVSLGAGGPDLHANDPLLIRYFDSVEITGPAPETPRRKPAGGVSRSTTRTGPSKKADADHVLLVITGVDNEPASQEIQAKLKALVEAPMPRMQAVLSRKGTLTVRLEPVPDVQALADRIDFGKVTRIQGRTIRVTVNQP